MKIVQRTLASQRNILLLLICLLIPATQHRAQENVGKGAPQVGQKAPDFTLPDVTGKPIRFSQLLAAPATDGIQASGKTRWLILIFYRGYW